MHVCEGALDKGASQNAPTPGLGSGGGGAGAAAPTRGGQSPVGCHSKVSVALMPRVLLMDAPPRKKEYRRMMGRITDDTTSLSWRGRLLRPPVILALAA